MAGPRQCRPEAGVALVIGVHVALFQPHDIHVRPDGTVVPGVARKLGVAE